MKKLITTISVGILTFSTSAQSQLDKQPKLNTYNLTGTFDGLPDKTGVYLLTQSQDTLDVTISQGNTFTFKKSLKLEGEFLFIAFDSAVTAVHTKSILVINRPMQVIGVIGKRDISVAGSPGHHDYLELINLFESSNSVFKKFEEDRSNSAQTVVNKQYDSNIEKDSAIKSFSDSMNTILEGIYSEQLKAKKEWATSHLISFVTPYLLISLLDLSTYQFVKKTLTELDSKVKEGYYVKTLEKKIAHLEIYKNFKQGSIIPNIQVRNTNGQKVYLHDIIKKNKLTLIDAWASWCTPCRVVFPALNDAYTQLRNQGFEIVSISSDRDNKVWKKALQEENISWSQFIELQELPFAAMCGIEAIPSYILVDQKGKMLAFDVALSAVKSFGGSLDPKSLVSTITSELEKL